MKSERLGFLIIFCALIVIGVTVSVFAVQQRNHQTAQVEAHASALTRLLGRMPTETLIGNGAQPGLIRTLFTANLSRELVFAAVADKSGRPIEEFLSGNLNIPNVALPATPTLWLGHRDHLQADGRTVREFYAPRLEAGELVGSLRIGFTLPELELAPKNLPATALVALFIFLLAALSYYLLRRELRPIRELNGKMANLLSQPQSAPVELQATGELGEFVQRFNQYVNLADERARALEHEHTEGKVLSYQKARVESVLESIPHGILVLDESAITTFANDQIGAILGVNTDELPGQPAAQWCEEADLREFLNRPARSHNRGARGILRFDRGPQTYSAALYPLFAPRGDNEVLGTLVVFTDVTAEAISKQERKELVAQLSHELKTPLHVMKMYAEMLLEQDNPVPELQVEAGNIIFDEVERVTALINNMLSISRIELGNFQLDRKPTRLADLLRDSLETVTRDARASDLKTTLDLPPDPCVVNVDKELLRIAIHNLLTNAVKYNVDGGEVSVRLEDNPDDIVIAIKDTGIGISAEEQGKIFEKFYRSASDEAQSRAGHGLGLSLAREITQLHLGELQLSSELGQGTEFRLVLTKGAGLLKEAS